MDDTSSVKIEMQETQATSGDQRGPESITREDSTEHGQLTEESQHSDIEEGPNVSSSELPVSPEESGSQGNDEVNSHIAVSNTHLRAHETLR